MDARHLPGQQGDWALKQLISSRWVGLQGRLARPFWGVMGLWAVLCGALASNQVQGNADVGAVRADLLVLGLVLLLADLGWGSLWDLIVGTSWRSLWIDGWPPAQAASLINLPYTQPTSPGGRLFRRMNRLAGWFRETLWPEAGPALLGVLAAAALAIVLTLLLPPRLLFLEAALLGLVGLGLVQHWRGRAALAPHAFVLVGLGWMAGHAAFAEVSRASLLLALAFSAAAWGSLRVASELKWGLWLLDSGQVAMITLLFVWRKPLAAALAGLFLFGQILLQPLVHAGSDPARIMRRTWPWLMAAMLVAAWASP
jgi:hypothetical protein